MIDFHTHILPKIDDGSKNKDMSISMLEILEKSDITDVVLTPHFYSDTESLNDFISKRNEIYNEFINEYRGNIKLHLGAEVYISNYLSNYEDLTKVCIDEKDYMLLELPFNNRLSDSEYQIIEMLIYDHNIKPIIAHIERYPFININKDLKVIDELISMGCLIQVNADSFLLSNKSKKFVLSLIEDDMAHLIGSDTHNITTRPPNYNEAIKIIKSELGQEYLNKIREYEKMVIK